MASFGKVKSAARGRWPAILSQLGVPSKVLNKRNQACPSCGGKDRFRYTNHNDGGGYICNQCGAGSGLDLLCLVNGWDISYAKDEVARIVDLAPYTPTRRMKHWQRAEMLNELWRTAHTIRPSDPAALFLEKRCGLTAFPPCLRAHDTMFYKGNPEAGEDNSEHFGMVAMVQATDGSCQTLHRTYLTRDGEKAAVASPRRIMPGSYAPGSCVRLMPAGPVLGVAEGIETALSAARLFSVPVWAALNAYNLSQFVPPPGVETVMVFGDNDPKFAGQAAAYSLAQSLSRRDIAVSVHIPDEKGSDWNDVDVAAMRLTS